MIPYLLQDLSYFAQMVPVIVSLFYSRRLSRPLMVFSYYLVLSLFSSFLNAYLGLHRIHNLWTANLFMPVQFGMLAYFFSFHVDNSMRRVVIWSIPCFFLLWAVDFLLFESILKFSTYAKPVEYVLLTFIAAFALFTNYRRNLSLPTSEPLFWIAAGVMLYFSSVAVLFSLSASLLRVSNETLRIAFSAQALISTLVNLSFASGILCLRRQSTYSGQPS